MNAEPVTLGNWYQILKPSDYLEAARLLNKGRPSHPRLPIFLRNWAPELIVGRQKWKTVSTRTNVAKRLSHIESLAQQLADALDTGVMEFLELPPHGLFESRLGTRIFVAASRLALATP